MLKIVGLLLSLVLLAIGILFVVLFGFASLSFNWEDFLMYLGIAVVVYAIVRATGESLNARFHGVVQRFLAGKSDQTIYDEGLLRPFGMLLVTMLPFLVYLLLFALYAAITFALYGMDLILKSPRIPVAIPIGFAIVVVGTGIATLIGFYYLLFPPDRKPFGIGIQESEHQPLWTLIREIGHRLGAQPINKVILTPDPGIGVYQSGSVFLAMLGRGRRTLEIGLPSLYGLSAGEFGAILAHEYGHFSHRDTQWSAFTYAMGNSLVRTLQSTPSPGGKGLVGFVLALNPAYWILRLFIALYFKVTSGFSRIREVMADVMAIEQYGGKAFANGLNKVALNDLVFGELVQQQVLEQLQQGNTNTNLSQAMTEIYGQGETPELQRVKLKLSAYAGEAAAYDSHPAIQTRLDYAGRFADRNGADVSPVTSLFDDWDRLNVAITELYYRRLFAYIAYATAAAGNAKPTT